MALFHRYESTIHGSYRKAYLRAGVLVGLLLGLYLLVRLLMRNPVSSPISLVADAILIVCLFLLLAHYRNALPEKKITLKEGMLFGMGTAVLASIVYGLLMWAICLLSPTQTIQFTLTMTQQTLPSTDPQLHYWAAWWAIVATVETALLGCFGAFLAALFFRNEKSTVKTRKQ